MTGAGASIACCRCGARPYPELSLPEIVREDFDLMKIGGQWFCSQHRPEKAPDEARAKSPIRDGIKKSSAELAHLADEEDFDSETIEVVRAVIERLDRLAEQCGRN